MKHIYKGLLFLILITLTDKNTFAAAQQAPIDFEVAPIYCERKYSLIPESDFEEHCSSSNYAERIAPRAFREEVSHYNQIVTQVSQDNRSNANNSNEFQTYELRRHYRCLKSICNVIQSKCGQFTANNTVGQEQQFWCNNQAEKIFTLQRSKSRSNILRNQSRKSRALVNQKYTALSTRMKRYFHYQMADTIRQFNRFASKVTVFIKDPKTDGTTQYVAMAEPASQAYKSQSTGSSSGNNASSGSSSGSSAGSGSGSGGSSSGSSSGSTSGNTSSGNKTASTTTTESISSNKTTTTKSNATFGKIGSTTNAQVKLSHADAMHFLEGGKIDEVTSTRGTSGVGPSRSNDRTSLDQVYKNTIDKIIRIKQECNCVITITGGTEDGHAGGRGVGSHGGGDKLDLRYSATGGITPWIRNHPNKTKIVGGHATDAWRIDGIEFYHETSPAHWDIKFGTGGITPSS